MTESQDIPEGSRCFVTGEPIINNETARFTYEFDAWVSEEGQEIVEEDARAENPAPENEIIFREWYAQDESDAARWEMALRHLDYDNNFDGDYRE
tara:strand:- start:297 stop:581 length:285 start_codon:yes stop_codon:yes gene_type:complete